MMRRGIERSRDGSYHVRLSREERALLRSLPAQLTELLTTGDESLRRVFPPAHPDDPDAEREYQRLVRASLLEGKLEALRVFEETAEHERLSREQLDAWLGGLESLRLVLGTQLDVREDMSAPGLDPDDPDAPRLALYHWLSWLQDEVVLVLSP